MSLSCMLRPADLHQKINIVYNSPQVIGLSININKYYCIISHVLPRIKWSITGKCFCICYTYQLLFKILYLCWYVLWGHILGQSITCSRTSMIMECNFRASLHEERTTATKLIRTKRMDDVLEFAQPLKTGCGGIQKLFKLYGVLTYVYILSNTVLYVNALLPPSNTEGE